MGDSNQERIWRDVGEATESGYRKSIISGALEKVGEHPEEFLSPGITVLRENYVTLKQSYEVLVSRMAQCGVVPPPGISDVRHAIKSMESAILDVEENLGCLSHHDGGIEQHLRYLEFVETYFLNPKVRQLSALISILKYKAFYL